MQFITSAYAESGPVGIYVNLVTNECGELWTGDEYWEYLPEDGNFEFLQWDDGSGAAKLCAVTGYDYIGELKSEPTQLIQEDLSSNSVIFYIAIAAIVLLTVYLYLKFGK